MTVPSQVQGVSDELAEVHTQVRHMSHLGVDASHEGRRVRVTCFDLKPLCKGGQPHAILGLARRGSSMFAWHGPAKDVVCKPNGKNTTLVVDGQSPLTLLGICVSQAEPA